MWSKKGALLAVTSISLIAFALLLRNYQLITTAIAILSLLTLSSITNKKIKITAKKKLSHEKIFENGVVEVELDIQNIGRATGLFEIRDKLPKEFKIRNGNNYFTLDMKAKEKTKIKYTLECPIKGHYPIGPVFLRSQDLFNLFYNEEKLEITDNLLVFPKIYDVKEMFIKTKTPKMYPGAITVKQPGIGTEFYALREYMPGDSFRDINWKAYARFRNMMVNQHEIEATSDVTIILDAREVTEIGTLNKNSLIFGARATATLTSFFLKRRDNVALIIYNDTINTILPSSREQQLYNILISLAATPAKGNMPLLAVVDVTIPRLCPKSPVILISNLEEDKTIQDAVSKIRAHDFDLTIISPTSPDFEFLTSGISPIAYDIMKVKRENLLKELRGFGARVIDWKPDTTLISIIKEAKSL